MDRNTHSAVQRIEKTDWQLFTNDGKFDSKVPPYKRLLRLKSAPATGEGVNKVSFNSASERNRHGYIFLSVPIGFKVYMVPASKPKVLISEKPQPQVENVENYVLVWLDQSTGKAKNNEASKNQLKQIVNCVKIFTDPKECQAYMSSIKDEKIFLIVSGTIEEDFVSNVHEEEQLESIYVFCPNMIKEEPWFNKYPEISGIYTTMMSLCEQLGEDVRRVDRTFLSIEIIGRTISSNTSKTNQQDASFMYDQLFRDIVLKVLDENMEDMYEFCATKYRENINELSHIKELRTTYKPDGSIWWYSRDTFLYKMLNKALRTHQYDTLYSLRVYIRHLHEQIAAEQGNETMKKKKLFRGQEMKKVDFDRLCETKGGLISFSNFVSTSEDREVSLGFVRRARVKNKHVFVLMEITVEKNTIVPAANITKLSCYPTESEWLFSMGSVFRVGPIKSSDGIWIVPLTLTDDHDVRLTALKEHFKESMSDRNTCFSFAKLMHQLAKWKQCEYFYQMALKTETTPDRRAVLYNDLALVKGELKQYDQSLALYEMSLKLKTTESDKATTYNNIGTFYHEQDKVNLAKTYYQKALDACNAGENKNERLQATLNINIAVILNSEGKHEDALEKCEEALKIRIKIFPEIHPCIANTYISIASTLQHLKMYEKAIEYAEKALDIDRQALPPEHPQTVLHENNLEVYKQRQQQQSN